MQHFCVFYNRQHPQITPQAEKLIASLKSRGYRFPVQKTGQSQFVVVLGGDGTLLKTVAALYPCHLPVLDVSLGRVGFLSEIEPRELEMALQRIQAGRYSLERRSLLTARLRQAGTFKILGCALNDVVLANADLSRILDFKVSWKGFSQTYRGDGVIVATPTGSTAYNLSAGGPILKPHARKILVTPICPQLLNSHAHVLNENQIVRLQVQSTARQKIMVTLDGQRHFGIKMSDILEVKKDPEYIEFIRFKPFNLGRRLKTKLKRN